MKTLALTFLGLVLIVVVYAVLYGMCRLTSYCPIQP